MNIAQYSTTLNLQYLLLKFAVPLAGNFNLFSLFVALTWAYLNPIPKSFLKKTRLIPFQSKLIIINYLPKFKLAKMIAFPNKYSLKTLLDKHTFLKLLIQHLFPELNWFCTGKPSIVTNHAETVLQPDLLKHFKLYKFGLVPKEKLRFLHSKRYANKALIFPRPENLLGLRLFLFDNLINNKNFIEIIRPPEKEIKQPDLSLSQQKHIIQDAHLRTHNTINIEEFYKNCLRIKYPIKLHSVAYFFQFQEQLIQIPTNERKKQNLYTKY
jgi:hypothetical protein